MFSFTILSSTYKAVAGGLAAESRVLPERLQIDRVRGSWRFRSTEFWKGIEYALPIQRVWVKCSGLPLARGVYGLVRMYLMPRVLEALANILEM